MFEQIDVTKITRLGNYPEIKISYDVYLQYTCVCVGVCAHPHLLLKVDKYVCKIY